MIGFPQISKYNKKQNKQNWSENGTYEERGKGLFPVFISIFFSFLEEFI